MNPGQPREHRPSPSNNAWTTAPRRTAQAEAITPRRAPPGRTGRHRNRPGGSRAPAAATSAARPGRRVASAAAGERGRHPRRERFQASRQSQAGPASPEQVEGAVGSSNGQQQRRAGSEHVVHAASFRDGRRLTGARAGREPDATAPARRPASHGVTRQRGAAAAVEAAANGWAGPPSPLSPAPRQPQPVTQRDGHARVFGSLPGWRPMPRPRGVSTVGRNAARATEPGLARAGTRTASARPPARRRRQCLRDGPVLRQGTGR